MGSDYWKSEKYADVITELERAGFSKDEIDSIFSDSRVKFYPDIAKKLKKTAVPKLTGPDSKLLLEESINRGKEFMREHKDILEEVENKYWIKKEAIVATLRIESNLGDNLGSDQVFGILNSIILYSEADSDKCKGAKGQLIAFLTMCRREGINPFEIYGSCAGAFGIPQFMPTSYLRFAVDGNNDGKIDLFNWEDAIHSTANYLIKHALYYYNRSWNYVDGIETYAEKLKEKAN